MDSEELTEFIVYLGALVCGFAAGVVVTALAIGVGF